MKRTYEGKCEGDDAQHVEIAFKMVFEHLGHKDVACRWKESVGVHTALGYGGFRRGAKFSSKVLDDVLLGVHGKRIGLSNVTPTFGNKAAGDSFFLGVLDDDLKRLTVKAIITIDSSVRIDQNPDYIQEIVNKEKEAKKVKRETKPQTSEKPRKRRRVMKKQPQSLPDDGLIKLEAAAEPSSHGSLTQTDSEEEPSWFVGGLSVDHEVIKQEPFSDEPSPVDSLNEPEHEETGGVSAEITPIFQDSSVPDELASPLVANVEGFCVDVHQDHVLANDPEDSYDYPELQASPKLSGLNDLLSLSGLCQQETDSGSCDLTGSEIVPEWLWSK